MLTNFRRSQADQDPLTLEQARRIWQRSENPLYDVVQILYGTVEHLVELRHRIFFVLGAVVVGAIATRHLRGPDHDVFAGARGRRGLDLPQARRT